MSYWAFSDVSRAGRHPNAVYGASAWLPKTDTQAVNERIRNAASVGRQAHHARLRLRARHTTTRRDSGDCSLELRSALRTGAAYTPPPANSALRRSSASRSKVSRLACRADLRVDADHGTSSRRLSNGRPATPTLDQIANSAQQPAIASRTIDPENEPSPSPSIAGLGRRHDRAQDFSAQRSLKMPFAVCTFDK